MIASMTGYGRGEATVSGYESVVELKSVNSRYCEISLRSPKSLNEREGDINRIIKEAFSRGRISAFITVTDPTPESVPYRVNPAAVRSYRVLLDEIRREAGIEEPVRLDHIIKYPDVLEADHVEENLEAIWQATEQALRQACVGMQAMRLQEGAALRSELEERLSGIETKLREVERLSPIRVTSSAERMRERLTELIEEGRIDRERIEFEMAMLADKLDVREECVRLDSHLVQVREAMASGEPVGRKLNFLSQEMNREINTIGSKSNDAEMAHLVVGMKEELEKIKEQVENVE
ncbi:MAG: YicC family protein [Bacteroidetes bacterium]|nr:YicC family protein [Bacteroidota bacterium]MDA0875158.1 YicC family protein [Bacteroidota bacterium]